MCFDIKKIIFLIFFISSAIFTPLRLGEIFYSQQKFLEENNEIKIEKKEIKPEKTLLFLGDIMLDRGVEYQMKKNSIYYPFEKIKPFLGEADFLIANLEGPIVEHPKKFSDNSLMFAFASSTIEGLSFAGFNILSLANNHTLNMGKEGLAQTKNFLKKANIDFFGDPIKCDESSLLEKENIIFLAFNKTFSFNCTDEEIINFVKEVKNGNPEKFLIVFFHWGQEYQLKSSYSQQNLAHKIIDTGADLVLGAHPHVVQEIEEYKGKIIFYSLGNFVFDQYFSKETQEGLAIKVEIYPAKIIYKIFPIKSVLSQPFLIEDKEKEEFLEKLAKRSSEGLFEKIKNGMIEIKR